MRFSLISLYSQYPLIASLSFTSHYDMQRRTEPPCFSSLHSLSSAAHMLLATT